MKVAVKEFGLDLDVKNKGMTLGVADTRGKHIGNIKITKTGLTWFNGKSQSGQKVKWDDFIEWMNS